MQTTCNVQNLLLPNMSGFKLASLNTTSLVKHIDELRVYLSNNVIDVLASNVTRLDSTIGDNEVHILDTKLFGEMEIPMVDLAVGFVFVFVAV